MTEPTTTIVIRGTTYRLTRAQLDRRYQAGEISIDEQLAAESRLDAAPPPPPAPGAGGPSGPMTRESLAKLPKKEQRRLARDDWPGVQAALSGRTPIETKLTPAELTREGLANLAKSDPDRLNAHWSEVDQALRDPKTGGSR